MSDQPVAARAARGYERIVVGVDGSPPSLDGLRRAAELAERFASHVTALCVWSNPIALVPPPATWHPDRDAEQIVAGAANAVFGAHWPTWFETGIREGAPALVLSEETRSADLLVVGDRGFGGFTGLLLGSVSSYRAQHSSCPLLITHDLDRAVR